MNTTLSKQIVTLIFCCLLVLFTTQAGQSNPTNQSSEQSSGCARARVVARAATIGRADRPIPRPLVAHVLAASTYPTKVIEADRWMRQAK